MVYCAKDAISGYRAWLSGGKVDRIRLSDARAVALLRSVHAEVKGAYGSRRIHRELQARDFTPAAANRVWTSDITYVWMDQGWLYLAVVMDLFNRQIVANPVPGSVGQKTA